MVQQPDCLVFLLKTVMIKHIVFFKLASDPQQYEAHVLLEEVKYQLSLLPALIPGIESFDVQTGTPLDARSADLVLLSEFRTWEDLQAYQLHPAHLSFVEWNRLRCPKLAVADFEF